jgi:hypothetical protein
MQLCLRLAIVKPPFERHCPPPDAQITFGFNYIATKIEGLLEISQYTLEDLHRSMSKLQ